MLEIFATIIEMFNDSDKDQSCHNQSSINNERGNQEINTTSVRSDYKEIHLATEEMYERFDDQIINSKQRPTFFCKVLPYPAFSINFIVFCIASPSSPKALSPFFKAFN